MGALRTGAHLQEVYRRQGRTGWWQWVKQRCPQLSKSTAYRYLDLARKFPRVRKPEDIRNLRQAYLAIELIPDEREKAKPKKTPDLNTLPPAPSGTDVASRVRSTWEFLGAELARIDLATLAEVQRQHLRQELATLLAGTNAIMARLDETAEVSRPTVYRDLAGATGEVAL